MRTAAALIIAAPMAAVGFAQTGSAPSAALSPQICGTEGVERFLCGPSRPEDLYAIPKTNWIVASSIGGGIHLIDARKKTTVQIYPSATAKDRLDKTRYPTCQAAPDADEKHSFSTLGLAMRLGTAGVHTLYAIRYPNVSRVHAFELDVRGQTPSATWTGCVEAPEGILLNSLVPMPDGGFLATHFFERGPNSAAARERAAAGEITGWLVRWHARTGWVKVDGSDTSGPNGIELSRDGQSVYISEWGRSSFLRMSLRGTPRRESVQLPFRPDNVHWGPDGMLLVGGATETESNVVEIDPRTLKVKEILRRPDTALFFHASVAVEVDDEIWLGTARGDRIAILPRPQKK